MADRYHEQGRSPYGRERYNEDRGTMDRAGDEVRSWFGDDEAARRRQRDERADERARGDDWSRRQREQDRRADLAYYRRETEMDFGGGSAITASSGFGAAYATRPESAPWRGDEGMNRDTRSAGARRGAERGNQAGRGPKGYRRSDERIREDISDRLTDDPMIDASDIEVMVNDAEVTLSGFIRGREDKRRAEDIAEQISGVRDVHNSLRLRRDDTSAEKAQEANQQKSGKQ